VVLLHIARMKIVEPPYKVITSWENDWCFAVSSEIVRATKEFDALLEKYGGYFGGWSQRMAVALRKFLLKNPNHIDGLHHYASCLYHEGKYIEALAFAEAAVGTGMRAIPKSFVFGKDRLPTGYVGNRPFIRACQGLMLAQWALDLENEAIATAEFCLSLDKEDRMGVRESLALYLIKCGRDRAAITLFENPAYKETFSGTEYLYALALIRLGEEERARAVLKQRLSYQPQIARFIIDKTLGEPVNDSSIGGVAWGSPIEGWIYACQFGNFWRSNRKAMKILREESIPCIKRGWKREHTKLVNVHIKKENDK